MMQLMQTSAVIPVHSNRRCSSLNDRVPLDEAFVHQPAVDILLEVRQPTRKGRYSIYPSKVRGLWL